MSEASEKWKHPHQRLQAWADDVFCADGFALVIGKPHLDDIRALLAERTWRPIATVPKEDQVPVLLLIEGEPGVCRWCTFLECWSSDRDLLDPDKATHWMPIHLPEPTP